MTEPVEPHAVIFRRDCPLCDADAFDIITIPKLATGEYFALYAVCSACGVKCDFKDMAPFTVRPDERRDRG
jgi:hypothetical protein